MFTYINGYCEVYRRFEGDFFWFGGGGSCWVGVTWEDLSMEEFVIGEENFNEGVKDFLALFKKEQ